MTQPPVARFTRAIGVGLVSAALALSAAGTSHAAPGLPEPIATVPGTPAPSIEEQLAQLGDKALTNRWFVEVDGAAKIQGGNPSRAKQAQDKVLASAKAEGIKVSAVRSFTSTWNGLVVTADAASASKLGAIAGVKSVQAVSLVERPVQDALTIPDIDNARGMTGADVANELGFTGKGVKVGIIDSGIDYNHPDFGGSGTNDETSDFPGERVKWGYDYVGDDYDASSDDPAINTPKPDKWPDDCGGHGTHVAGIVGADGGVTGVAPDVEFGAYRIFGCDGSSDSEIIIEAMEDAYADGMDIVNMSLGASLQTWPTYPTAQAADRLVDAGVVVVVSQGNSGTSGTFSGGAPSVAHNVISVGSVDNTEFLANYVATEGGLELPFFAATGAQAFAPGTSYDIVLADGELDYRAPGTNGIKDLGVARPIEGCQNNPPSEATEEGQALLVSRGTCSFHEKAVVAQALGYDALLIYNNTGGVINATVEGATAIEIPVATLLQADGLALVAEIPEGGSAPIVISVDRKRFDNPTGGYQSDFSSYGLAADLTLKPDVSAPGGSIYSTYPLEEGGYASLGGTSMAAPHVAGAAAILLQARPDLDPYQVRTVLTNTANPFIFGTNPALGWPEPVHRQGAGMIDIPHAITTTTYVEPQKISLGEGEAGPVTTTVKITNLSDEEATYTLGVQHGLTTYGISTDSFSFYRLGADVEFSSTTVTVPAGATGSATVTIGEDFGVDGAIFGGWLTVDSGTEQLVVPFAGLSGDYQALTALEFAALTYVNASGGLSVAPPFHTYTMTNGDYPVVALYLAYPVSALYLDVYAANPDGTKGRKVHSNFINYATEYDLGRFSALATITWDGTYQGNAGSNGKVRAVADGDYVLELRILKALGDPNNPDHWETWNSTALTIDRADATGDPSGYNGPGPDNPNKGKGNNGKNKP